MIDEFEWVRSERPDVESPTPQARRRARHALDEAIGIRGARRGRRRLNSWLTAGNIAAAAALLVVFAVVALFLGSHTRKAAAPAPLGGPEVVFRAEPTAHGGAASHLAVREAASLLQALISRSLGRVSVTSSGSQVVVQVPRGASPNQLTILSFTTLTGRLAFYDWEANALTANGKSVASQLARQSPEAVSISQGGGTLAPGSAGAGSMSLYSAVRLASKQPPSDNTQASRPGAEYFAFGNPHTAACATAAHDYGVPPTTTLDAHCYLAGPAPNAEQLRALLPANVTPASAQTLAVPAGTAVLEATPTSFARRPGLADPYAQFFVLHDRPAMLGTAITNPTTDRDASGSPDIKFGFTPRGGAAFQRVTADIAQRGDLVSGLGQTLDQHFAVALGDQLVTIPSIDFKSYPDGIRSNGGADITGGFTRRSVQTALLEVRLGSLPITLRLVSTG